MSTDLMRLNPATKIVGEFRPRMLIKSLSLSAVFCLSSSTLAQVPGKPLIWYDASDLAVGQSVEVWQDKSANGHDAFMPEAGARPSVTYDNDGVQSVRFVWGQYLQVPSIYPTLSD